jgi:hypothetical protein
VLRNPANRHNAVGLTCKQFHYAFTNTLSEGESAKVYERCHVPGVGHILAVVKVQRQEAPQGHREGRLQGVPRRSHYTLGQDGWEAVADYALDWAIKNAEGNAAA